MATCEDCRYFTEDDHLVQQAGYTLGTCRCHPPVFSEVYDPTVARFPVVRGNQRACGEFKVSNLESIEI